MKLTGLHLLLTYQCTLECDHCFVWGSPRQTGTMTLDAVRTILDQASELGTISDVGFEGGEPFLYHPLLVESAREAARRFFRVEIVTNGYWATSAEDALLWLKPLANSVTSLSVSCDSYHFNEERAARVAEVADKLGIAWSFIRVSRPGRPPTNEEVGVRFRGRAATALSGEVPRIPWHELAECPYENLRDPGRVHVDPLGNLHLCQGISLGNLFRKPLREILADFDPEMHPIVGPLLEGGPAELAGRYQLPHGDAYADACHLCCETRARLRYRFPEILAPDQMYGQVD